VQYLVQAALGQMELFNRARPIPEVLQDPRLEPRYRAALEEIPELKAFVEQMGLKATPNYQEFVDLRRDAVVWVVSACEPLKLEAKRWSFPVVGGFSYIGWFDRERALSMRDRLRDTGLDADVRGAAAYSTLGWFRDPVLSTLIRKEDPFGFIETLIHESVHATLHLKSLSTLNESLAQFVAEKLTPLYLEKSRGKEAAKEFDLDLKESRRRKALIREAYSDLEILYNSGQDEATQRERKRIRLEKLRGELQWPQSRELNNATLVQFSTYESGAVGFEKLWSFCGGSLGAFLTAISRGEADLRSASEGDLDAALERLQKYCAR